MLLCKVSSPSATSSLSRRPDPGRVFLFVFAGERNTERGEERGETERGCRSQKASVRNTAQRRGCQKEDNRTNNTESKRTSSLCTRDRLISDWAVQSTEEEKSALCLRPHFRHALKRTLKSKV